MGHLRYGLILRSFLRPSGQARFVSTWSVRCNNGFLNGSELTRNRQFEERFSDKCYVPECCESFHFRRFSVALENEVHHVESEAGLDDVKKNSETMTEEVETAEVQVKSKKERKEKIPSEVGISLVFERAKLVESIVAILRKGDWNEETTAALEALLIQYDSQLVTQVLRVCFPLNVSLGFFNWLKGQAGFKHTEFTYGVMLNTLGKGGHMSEMHELFAEMQKEGLTVTPVIISCIMHWSARVVDSSTVVYQWRKLKLEGTKPSLGIYTAYLDYLIRSKRFTKIPLVYETMLTEECLPNGRLYTLLIQHLADAGRLRAAVNILEIMQKLYVVPGRVAYEFIINGYLKEENLEKVEEFLNEMRERFHRPSKRLIPVIKAFEVAGKTEQAAVLKGEIWHEDNSEISVNDEGQTTEESGSGMSEDILDSLMGEWRDATSPHVGFDVNAFAQALHTWNAEVETVLEEANVQWRSSLVLEVLRRLRNLDTSWPFFHWVKNRAGFKHDVYSCMVMIQRILKSRSSIERTASLVDELFEEMQRDGIKFTVPMFNMMIRHYVLARDITRAEEMFVRIRESHLEPNAASYSPLIQAFARDRQGKRAMDILQEMQEAGFHPDSITNAELITCLDLAEKLPSAYELFCKIPESGRSHSPLEYKAIMAAYSRAKDQKMALKLYEQMRGAGIKPTQDMFDEVSVILRNANRQYDINTIANFRKKLKYFKGRKKAMQEDLLQVLDSFMRSMKPRPNNAYASNRKTDEDSASDGVDDTASNTVEAEAEAEAETETESDRPSDVGSRDTPTKISVS